MKNILRKMMIVCLILFVGAMVFRPADKRALAQTSNGANALATVNITAKQITWQPLVKYASLTLTVVTPSGAILTHSFDSDNLPTLPVDELRDEGLYSYELRLTPALDAETQASLQAVADDPEARAQLVEELTAAGVLPAVASQSGTFSVTGGKFVIPVEEEVTAPSSSATQTTDSNAINDVVHADDVIVTGSLCVGFDCVDGESFSFDTIRLKENNTRITFDDTSSTAGFPANDWTLVANDSASDGVNYFAIEDVTGSKFPFKVVAGARTNAFYISSTGRIGFGTSTPVLDLHIVRGDTPSIRLDQDTSSGWTAQVWDIAGNESNFFIRDVTGGSRLPFRIRPGAPTSSIDINAAGNVGIGTASPAYDLDVANTGQNTTIVAKRTDGATAGISANASTVQFGSLSNNPVEMVVNDSVVMTMTNEGNMTLQGALSEYSDVNAKENFAPVDGYAVLERLSNIPVMTWNYIRDDAETPHMGPMAQDFYTAFGLGADDRHIAALDVNGVSLAAIQTLGKVTSDQKAQIEQLSAENSALKEQVDDLETRLSKLEQTVSKESNPRTSGLPVWSLVCVVILVGVMQAAPVIYRKMMNN